MKTTIIRTSLALTILASLAIGTLNIIRVREKITGLQTNLQTQTDARQRAENDLNRTQAELKTTTASSLKPNPHWRPQLPKSSKPGPTSLRKPGGQSDCNPSWKRLALN